MIPAAIILLIVVALAVWGIVTYNRLVRQRNAVDNAWAQIDVQLQRRLDLVPALVEVVSGYASHESQALQSVLSARAGMMGAQGAARLAGNDGLSAALKGVLAFAEGRPELAASQNFRQLQIDLADTEDKISYMRQSYNDTVMKYNTAIQSFPTSLVASAAGFKPVMSFDAHQGAEAGLNISIGTPAEYGADATAVDTLCTADEVFHEAVSAAGDAAAHASSSPAPSPVTAPSPVAPAADIAPENTNQLIPGALPPQPPRP